MGNWVLFLAVGLAGAAGSISRLVLGKWLNRTGMPIGTLLINLSGALFLGWFFTRYGPKGLPISNTLRQAIGVGFVGAYTTFSSYMFESDEMMRDGSWLRASAYLVGSLVLGLIAVRIGYLLGRQG